jgi:hypothetical protein
VIGIEVTSQSKENRERLHETSSSSRSRRISERMGSDEL